ncbi:hypothetical protein C8Q74DRAFT_1303022 [Fomes fomentarius]|nr:hypothetical protein C8Q74DRAFT_1303022 [Fomes fomentarius]
MTASTDMLAEQLGSQLSLADTHNVAEPDLQAQPLRVDEIVDLGLQVGEPALNPWGAGFRHEPRHACPFCECSYKRKNDLRRHFQAKHAALNGGDPVDS